MLLGKTRFVNRNLELYFSNIKLKQTIFSHKCFKPFTLIQIQCVFKIHVGYLFDNDFF